MADMCNRRGAFCPDCGYQRCRLLPPPTFAAEEAEAFVATHVASLERTQPGTRLAAALTTLLAEYRRRGEAWDWLSSRTNLSLDYDWSPEEDSGVWRVHRVSGHVNDQEWELISAATTALEAVLAARQALGGSDA